MQPALMFSCLVTPHPIHPTMGEVSLVRCTQQIQFIQMFLRQYQFKGYFDDSLLVTKRPYSQLLHLSFFGILLPFLAVNWVRTVLLVVYSVFLFLLTQFYTSILIAILKIGREREYKNKYVPLGRSLYLPLILLVGVSGFLVLYLYAACLLTVLPSSSLNFEEEGVFGL